MIECESHDQCEEDESDQISTGWSCENLETSTERGEDRDTNCSEQEVDDEADCFRDFIPRTKIARKIAKFVREIGTGLNGSGMESGPRTQVTAVIRAMSTICFVLIFWLSTATVPEVSFCDISIYSFRS